MLILFEKYFFIVIKLNMINLHFEYTITLNYTKK